jgi:septum formation protein
MLQDQLSGYKIILASQSPRRQQLLSELGLKFEVVINDFDESYPPHLKREEIALFLANSKANQLKNILTNDEIIITADTIVWCDSELLGKPATREEAVSILKKISGRTHEVITGVCIISSVKKKSFYSLTEVTFDILSDDEIRFYVDNFEPFDKAGAYGIQEWIGFIGIKHIKGSYFNVMGLPVQQLYKELQEFRLH